MPEARRNRRGLILIPLGIAALTAAAGAVAYWYLNRNNSVQKTPIRRNSPLKRKSVVIVLTPDLVKRIPSYDLSKTYADVYLIYPPAGHGLLDDGGLEGKVEHSTRVLSCATEEGVVHIARHIGADVVLLDHQYLWSVDQVKGWTKRVVCVEPKGAEMQIQDNVVRTCWPETMAFEELLSLDSH